MSRFLPRFRSSPTGTASEVVQEPATAEVAGAPRPSVEKSPGGGDEKLGDDSDAVVYTGEADASLNPGELTFEEDTAGGWGRHLNIFDCTMLIIGRVIGTGIFSTPSSILGGVGSVGASLMLWVLGFILSFCGLFIWLELGTMFPRSGGEKVYLEAAYRRPKYLATVIFAVNAIVLGFSSSGCIVFAQSILVAAQKEATNWNERGIALGVIFFVTFIHGITPKTGLRLMNALAVIKVVILVILVVAGWAVLAGHTRVADPHTNFRNAFAGSSHSSGDYATALYKVSFAYAGATNVNYVMNNVKNPVRTLLIAGPLGLGVCAVLYIFANIAYFAAASKEEILNSGTTVASVFFANVFGVPAERAVSVFVALSALGNVVSVTFASARINQELAKEGIPLPGGNRFWASNWPTGKAPLAGLVMHLIPSIIVIVAPPAKVAYPFILDLDGYPGTIISLFVVIGLFILRWKAPHVPRPFKVWWPLAALYLAVSGLQLVLPFLKPSNGVGDTPPLPYYLYCLVGIAVFILSILCWATWRVVLPRVFGYELVPRKETLVDGTVVTLFSLNKREEREVTNQ